MKALAICPFPVPCSLFPVPCFGFLFLLACSSDPAAVTEPPPGLTFDGGFVDGTDPDASKPRVDGGYAGIRADRFVTKIESFVPGDCSGFGATEMPNVVLGPPVGAGDLRGGLDVLSLGIGGEIVVSFEPNAIVDGPGADVIVFENAFYSGGNANRPASDPGEVSVSEDGTTWKTFATKAGTRPVYSAPANGISPVDPAKAGGDVYDLAEVGLHEARFVRIRDLATEVCKGQPKPTNLGFDLDAIAITNAKMP